MGGFRGSLSQLSACGTWHCKLDMRAAYVLLSGQAHHIGKQFGLGCDLGRIFVCNFLQMCVQ